MSNASYPSADTIHRHVLDNGIILLNYVYPAAGTVIISGSIQTGSVMETRQTAGLSGFVASCLMRGTATRSFDEVYETLEGTGARLSFGSGYQMTDFSAESLPEDFDLLLGMISDSLRTPTFPTAQIDRIRMEKLAALQMRNNDTRSQASRKFRDMLYGEDHPYGRRIGGYEETLMQISRDDLEKFHNLHYAPNDAVIVIVGPMAADKVLAQVTAALGGWSNPNFKPPKAIPMVDRPKGLMREHVDMPAKTQSDIVMGLPGPLRSNPQYQDARLANNILGVFGMMGRLGKTVREEQGLAYYASSSLSGGLGPQPWSVRTGVAPDKVEQAIDSIRTEIRRIQDEAVSAEELADSQAYLTGSMPLSIETSGGLAGVISSMELYDLGLDYLLSYADQINSVTRESLQAAAQKFFSADEIAIAVAGPDSH